MHTRLFSLALIAALGLGACTKKDESVDDSVVISPPVNESVSTGPLDGTEVFDGTTGVDSTALAGTQQDLVANIGDRVFFETNSSSVTGSAQDTLSRQASWLQQYQNVSVTVEGHADERGTREYNLALGERRATAIKNYLVNLGVDPRRVSTISYGKERPVELGSNPSSWSKNRRGVTRVD